MPKDPKSTPRNAPDHDTLKQRHRLARDGHPPGLTLRIHRALSWLKRAEQADDADGRFIFLWIAFNAAYAQESAANGLGFGREAFNAFLEKLCELDADKQIGNLIWKEFSGSIRLLLDNPYVFKPFWDFQRGGIDETVWKDKFAKARKLAEKGLQSGKTPLLLSLIFERLYTLRNQLIHGGATWNGSVNRDQMRDSTKLLGKLVPIIITLMMDNPNEPWGDAVYPVIEQ